MALGERQADTPTLLCRTAEDVDREDVIAAVCRTALIDGLVHVTNFNSPRARMMPFETKADEDSVLIKPATLAPVRVIESDEQFLSLIHI